METYRYTWSLLNRFIVTTSIIFMMTMLGVTAYAATDDTSDNSDDDAMVNYLADFEAVVETNKGEFIISFLPDHAPAHVLNFIALAETGFYDGLTFHRYVGDFVVQGGDPLGSGSGGPGYTLPAELSDDNLHMKGALGMARTGDDVNPERRSSGSQFYICLDDIPRLDGKYTVWGIVSKGMDIVMNLRKGDIIENIRIRKTSDAFEDDLWAMIGELEKKATDPVTDLKYKDLKAVVKTSKGDFELGFYYDGAPEHVAKFVELTHEGFYRNLNLCTDESLLLFEAFDPSADAPETVPFEYHPDYKHIKFAVGMPTFPGRDDDDKLSAAYQFYVCLDDISELNGEQTVWAFVAKGMEVVLELGERDTIESIDIVPLAETRHAGQ